MAFQRRKNHAFQALQFLFSQPSGFCTLVQPIQGLCALFIFSFLLFTFGAVRNACQKHLSATTCTPTAGNCPLQIPQTQSRAYPNRSSIWRSYIQNAHIPTSVCTCSSTICTPIIVRVRVLVNRIPKHLFVFVSLHNPPKDSLVRFYISATKNERVLQNTLVCYFVIQSPIPVASPSAM